MKRAFLMLALAASVTACGSEYIAKHRMDEFRIVSRDWVMPQLAATNSAVYCYRTLAKPDCFAEPQSGAENRLISYYGPQPK